MAGIEETVYRERLEKRRARFAAGPWMTDAPYTEELIARYNALTHFPKTAATENARFAAWAAEVEARAAATLARCGVEGMPEEVRHALNQLRWAQVDAFCRSVRAREMAPPWTVTGPARWREHARPEKAEKHLRVGRELEKAAREHLARVLGRYAPSRRISSDDPDAIVRLRAKIEDAERLQAVMREANRIVRSAKGGEEEKLPRLVALGIEEGAARRLFLPDFCGRVGFPDYALANNTANIRRMKQRVAEREKAAAEADSTARFPGGVVRDVVAANRLQIVFEARPPAEVAAKLKAQGFRWAPSVGAWQRHRSEGARRAAAQIVGCEVLTFVPEGEQPEPATFEARELPASPAEGLGEEWARERAA